MLYRDDFKELYLIARQRHPSLIALGDSIIQSIEADLQDTKKSDNTIRYIIVVSAALFFFATYPLLIAKAYTLTRLLQAQLAPLLSQREFLDNHYEIVVACIFVLFAAPFYTTVLPSSWRWKVHSKTEFPPAIKRMSRKFFTYTLIINYAVVFIPLLFLYSYSWISESILKWVTIVWLMLPLIIICALPSLILLVIIALFFRDRIRTSKPPSIGYTLLRLLNQLDEIQGLADLKHHEKQNIVKDIASISHMIKTLYRGTRFTDGATQWSIREMNCAGDNFMSLGSWVYFPQHNTLENLRERVCLYLNIFVSGHYHELPREKMGEYAGLILVQERISGLRRFMGLVFFVAYMGLPIGIFAVVITLFHITTPPLVQSALNILYIIWAVLGFFYFSEKLAPDAKVFLNDVIKSIIQRK